MGWLCGVGVFGLIECPHSLPALHSGLQNNNNYVIANEAMYIGTVAFKTPVKKLDILCSEPEFNLRRFDLLMRYFFNLKCHFENPAYSCVIDKRLELCFRSRCVTKPVIMRLRETEQQRSIQI